VSGSEVRGQRKPQRKAEVLSAFVDYLLKTGMHDLSLRPAAAALRTSPRMLVHYFGSKQGLLLAAIAEVRARSERGSPGTSAAGGSADRSPATSG
jgi:AcrR family transcriptional regulator